MPATPPDLLCVTEPWNAGEVALIHAALGATDIRYHIENEHHSQWADGTVGIAAERMRLLVERERSGEAREILEQALGRSL